MIFRIWTDTVDIETFLFGKDAYNYEPNSKKKYAHFNSLFHLTVEKIITVHVIFKNLLLDI